MSNEGAPAGWYDDPSKIGELRYFDGEQWTEHVTIDGVQTTAPLDTAPAEAGTAPTFTMSRQAQWRSEDEQPLDVVGRTGVMGRFFTMIDGTPGYRFDDVDGDTIVSVAKPSLKNAVEVRDPAGYAIGTITKVGRLRSRYEVAILGDGREATMKLLGSANDEWEVLLAGLQAATITRTVSSAADALNFASVEYQATVTAALDGQMERVLLVMPLAIDILDTQAIAQHP